MVEVNTPVVAVGALFPNVVQPEIPLVDDCQLYEICEEVVMVFDKLKLDEPVAPPQNLLMLFTIVPLFGMPEQAGG